MKLFNYLFSAFFVLVVTFAVIIIAGNVLYSYLDALSFLVIIIFVLPTSITLFGWNNFRNSLALPFRKRKGEAEEYKKAAEIIRSMGRQIYLASGLLFFIALIGILSYPNGSAENLSANFAVSLISIFYGLLLNLIFIEPLRAYLNSQS